MIERQNLLRHTKDARQDHATEQMEKAVWRACARKLNPSIAIMVRIIDAYSEKRRALYADFVKRFGSKTTSAVGY